MARPRKLPSGRWKIEIMIDGERHSKTFDLRRECLEYERQARTDHARGVFIPPDRQREKVADRLQAWLDMKASDPNFAHKSWVNYEVFVRCHIAPYLGRLTMEHLGVEAIERWRNELVEEKGTACAKKAHAVLSSFLSDQQRYGYVPQNAAKLVEAPRHRSREKTVLEPHELRALVEALGGKPCSWVGEQGNTHAMKPDHPDWELRSGWASDVALGLALIGCRFGDLASLTEGNWDRVNGRLRIDDQKTKRTRHLPVFPAVQEVLERCVARGGERLFMSDGRKGQARLWPAFNNDHFKPALERAGITAHVTPHDLRHFTASWLIKQGFGPAQVAAYLGHASPSVTLDTYSHLFADDMGDMGEVLDQMWEQAQQGMGDNVTPMRKAE